VTSERQAPAELPAAPQSADTPENQPALVESEGAVETRSGSLIPTIPDVTKAAARWIRPLVPPFVARAVDTTTQPLRAAKQVFEEVEEITFLLKRTHKVTVNTEETAVTTSRAVVSSERPPLDRTRADRDGQHELRESDGPRQLPPAE
jgi:hypothetical protein